MDTNSDLYKQYGQCVFEMEVLQARIAALKDQLVREYNEANVPDAAGPDNADPGPV